MSRDSPGTEDFWIGRGGSSGRSARDARKAQPDISGQRAAEFISKALDLWAYQASVTLDFSRPGKPAANAYIESQQERPRLESLGRSCLPLIPIGSDLQNF